MDGMMIIATAPITDIILITFCGPIKCSLKKLNDIEVSGDIAIQHIHFPYNYFIKIFPGCVSVLCNIPCYLFVLF